MHVTHVKLSYERVIQEALEDRTMRDNFLTLIRKGKHEEEAAKQVQQAS